LSIFGLLGFPPVDPTRPYRMEQVASHVEAIQFVLSHRNEYRMRRVSLGLSPKTDKATEKQNRTPYTVQYQQQVTS